MTLLVDTNALIWFAEDAPNLSAAAKAALEHPDNAAVYSLASIWEMAIKLSLSKLEMSRPLYPDFQSSLEQHGFEALDISFRHVAEVAHLPFHHRDPFDRLLIGQAVVEGLPIVSSDAGFDAYEVTRIW